MKHIKSYKKSKEEQKSTYKYNIGDYIKINLINYNRTLKLNNYDKISAAIVIGYTTSAEHQYRILLLNNEIFWTNDKGIIDIISKEEYNKYEIEFTADKYNL